MPVTVGDNMSISVAGLPYELRSTAEQYRARVALQIVLAGIDGSAMLVIDAADVLDKPGRNGLIKAVLASGIPSIIAMTYNAASDAPRADFMETYWAEDGSVDRAQ